jgi:hypothetical protein
MNNFLEWLEQKHPEYLNEQIGDIGLSRVIAPERTPKEIEAREDLLKNYLPVTDADIDKLPIDAHKRAHMKRYYHMKNLVADTWFSGYLSDRTLLSTFFPGSDSQVHYNQAEQEFKKLIASQGWKTGKMWGFLYASDVWFRPKTDTEKYKDVRFTINQLQNKIDGLIDKNKINAKLQQQRLTQLHGTDREIPVDTIDSVINEKEKFIKNYLPLDGKYIFDKYKNSVPDEARLALHYLTKMNMRNNLTPNKTMTSSADAVAYPFYWLTEKGGGITREEQAAFKEIKDREYYDEDHSIEWKQFGSRWYRTKTKEEQIADARKEISELQAKMKELEKTADKSETGLSALEQLEKFQDERRNQANSLADREKEMIKSGQFMIGPDGKLLRDLKGNPIPTKKDTKSKDRYIPPDPKDDIYRSEDPPLRTPKPRSESESEPVDPYKVLPTRPAPKRPAGSSTKKNNDPYANRR